MRVRLKGYGSLKPPDYLDIPLNGTVGCFKKILSNSLGDPSVLKDQHLVCGGIVLRDDSLPLTYLKPEESIVCLLPPSASILRNELEVHDWIEKIVDLQIRFEPSDAQRDKRLVKLLKVFIASLTRDYTTNLWKPSDSELQDLKYIVDVLENDSLSAQTPQVTWFREYGCALLSSASTVDDVKLTLICLDQWSFSMLSGPTGRKHSAHPGVHSSVVLFIGTVRLPRYSHFIETTHILLKEAQKRTGEKRSVASNKQGHQKTPAMIQAIMVDALKNLVNCTAPRGGFTDVGLHTGGKRRNVTWPLLRAVVQTLLESRGRDLLYGECTAQLYLWLAESAVAHLSKASKAWKVSPDLPGRQQFRRKVDSVMQVLRVAGQEAITLAKTSRPGYDIAAFEVRCVRLRSELDEVISKRASVISRSYDLAPFSKADLGLKNVEISLPEQTKEKETPGNLRKPSKLERKNLSGLPSPLTNDASWAQIDKWLQDDLFQRSENIEANLLACTAVETYFYNKIRLEVQPVNVKDVEIIHSVVDKYRIIASELRNFETAAALFSVDLLSREILVVWCAFCIVHITASVSEPLLRNFSVALDEGNLGNLVLSEKLAVDAAIQVVKYIHKHSEMPTCLFSLRNHDQTIEFAKAHAQSAKTTQIAWSIEKKNAKDRQDEHWKQVCYKKERLQDLDKELSTLESQKGTWQTILDSTVPNQFHSAKKNRTREEAEKEVKRYTSELLMKRNQIHQIEQPPLPILQPLPQDKEKAMPILFFLMMPPIFQVLSHLSFSAQQMMLPSGDSVRLAKPGFSSHCGYDISSAYELPPCTEWHSYYMTKSTARSYTAVKTRVILGSQEKKVEGKWYPSNVRKYTSRDEGVWYPDALFPRMYWSGGGFRLDPRPGPRPGLFFNPFRNLRNEHLIPKFTEKLAAEDSSLQWMVEQHGGTTTLERGNWTEAAQNEQPAWVSGKEEYLALGALRAYPYQQVRKVIISLRERTLSLQIPSVRTILRQALYHLGDISMEQERTYWRTDLFVSDGWKALDLALDSLAAELRFKSRDYEAVRTLGEIAAYASQWYPMSRQTSRKFAKAVRQWADDLAAEEESAEGQKVVDILAKRSLLYMIGMVCFSMGDLSEEDVAQLIQLLFLAEYSRLIENPSPHDVAVQELTTSTRALMARRIPEVLQIVDSKPQILTGALQLVLEATPNCLHWKRIERTGQPLNSYNSISSDRHLFTVNLLTGVVLFDGAPLRRLPKAITALPLYQRTFSKRSFEVVQKKSGAFQTVRCVKNCFYEFDNSTGRLIITELYSQSDQKLELLDGTLNGIKVWGSRLPIRLKEMYSHWLCRIQNAVLLRPKLFYERTVHYIITNEESCATESADIRTDQGHLDETKGSVCYRIPEHRIEEDWNVLVRTLRGCDKLVVPNLHHATVLEVLRKFEPNRENIHCLLRPNDTLLFEIPRFNLVFELSEEGTLLSKNFQSFRLSQKQHLEDSLHDFTQYLVLESGNQQKVLIPAGVIKSKEELVFVNGSQKCNATRSMHVYDIHERFLSFDATKGNLSVEARLQLAAIHASTSSMVPDTRFHKTGYETTVDLLRQSWVNRPLTTDEHMHVATISKFGILCPSVSLLCHHLDSCSRTLEFLYPKHTSEKLVALDCDAATEYVLLKQGRELSPRAALTADEETEILGTQIQTRSSVCFSSSRKSFKCAMPRLNSGIISLAERELSGMISTSKSRGSVPFPLNENELSSTSIGKEMISGLRRSWQAYHELPSAHLNTLPVKIATEAEKVLIDCTSARLEVEKQIICALSMVPDAIGWHKHCFIIRRAVNLEPEVSLRDLGNLACSRTKIHEFNPFLTSQEVQQVHSSIMKWLEICVIEDKMKRVLDLSRSGNEQELIMELQETGREWDVLQHPEWLVFEVEQQLQIRNLQYSEAKFCMENPGAITQLNMGEGKTRVILPMLLLQLANREQLVRLHFLSPLLKDSYDFLHHTITASILCRRLYLLPFHRDVKPTPRNCSILLECLKRCQRSQGAICLAPEHRLSLHLKWHELGLSSDEGSQKLRSELESISQLPYFDIFDESDEVLHHKYQLIYAVGNCIPLPAGKVRWEAAGAALKQFQYIPSISRDFRAFFRRTQREGRGSGIFDDIRISPGKELQKHRKRLLVKVASGLISDPPHHFRWLKNHPLRRTLISFMTDRSKNLDWLLSRETIELKDVEQVEALLAFRGLLACGLMEHCLSRRFQVDYGIDSKRGIRHRVAVPYRASDTPSERAEYAQPDTLILFTLLAYYHGGISRAELKEATEALLQLGPIAQKAEYCVWFETAAQMMTAEQISAMNTVDKVDPTSDVHLQLMHEVYRYNMAVIDFWLGTCVFSRETVHFPQRIVANAFHLAHNEQGKVVGFSGTKDNKILLPLQVKQQVPNLQTAVATDGKMLELILKNDEVICFGAAKSLSSSILEFAVKRRTQALIDTGATMAGLPNQQVALQILELLKSDEKDRGDLLGVVYFDKDKETWMVMNHMKRSWPLGASLIHESNAFVYFDESRCRGTDMKLRENATALLTLSPFMSKDKLMQGAGRMRKLDQGQRLIFAVPADVVPKLQVSGTSMKSLDLLQWVMQNTSKGNAAGLMEWGSQGNYFCSTRDPTARLIDDIIEVKDLYANSLSEQTVEVIVRNGQRRHQMRLDALSIHMDNDAKAMKDIIANHVTKYGADQTLISSSFEEECERETEQQTELETEVQQQNEVQRQIPRQKPNNPLLWDTSVVLKVSDPTQLGSVGVKNLSDVMKNRFPSNNLARIRWDLCRIFVTKSFIETVLTVDGGRMTDLGNFMRPVDAMLVFQPDASCLLLSEWEADRVLSVLWTCGSGSRTKIGGRTDHLARGDSPAFVNLTFLIEKADRSDDPSRKSVAWAGLIEGFMAAITGRSGLNSLTGLSEHTLAGLQLFAGCTMFGTAARKTALSELLPTHGAKQSALNLIALRGLQNMISCSDLELICDI